MTDDIEQILEHAQRGMDLAWSLFTDKSWIGTEKTYKNPRDFATEVDTLIEDRLRAYFSEVTPQFDVLGEERGVSGIAGEYTWIIDPIDGTANFSIGSPLCGISICALHNGSAVVAVIGFPRLKERYWAASGQGAHDMNGPIHVQLREELSRSIVSIGDFSVEHADEVRLQKQIAIVSTLARKVERVRMFGSAAIDITWVAAGRIASMVMLANKPWDTLGAVLIAREAGAAAIDIDGTQHTKDSLATIVTTPGLEKALLASLQEATANP